MIAAPERPPVVAPELPELGRTPIARRLIMAAMLLARDGWTQGEWRSGLTGGRCISAALWSPGDGPFCGSTGMKRVVYREWDTAFLLLNSILGRSAIGWNDSVCASGEEAIAVLMQAAEEATRREI